MARLPSLRLFMGLCSDSLISSGRGEERLLSEEDLALSLSSIISWSARLTASGTASLPDSLRGRPRFRLGPRKLGEGRLVWWRGEEAPSNVGVKGRRQVVMGSRDGVVRHRQWKP